MASLLHSHPEALAVLRSGDGIFLETSSRLSDMLQISPQYLQGVTIGACTWPKDHQLRKEQLTQLEQPGDKIEHAIRWRNAHGQPLTIQETMTLIDKDHVLLTGTQIQTVRDETTHVLDSPLPYDAMVEQLAGISLLVFNNQQQCVFVGGDPLTTPPAIGATLQTTFPQQYPQLLETIEAAKHQRAAQTVALTEEQQCTVNIVWQHNAVGYYLLAFRDLHTQERDVDSAIVKQWLQQHQQSNAITMHLHIPQHILSPAVINDIHRIAQQRINNVMQTYCRQHPQQTFLLADGTDQRINMLLSQPMEPAALQQLAQRLHQQLAEPYRPLRALTSTTIPVYIGVAYGLTGSSLWQAATTASMQAFQQRKDVVQYDPKFSQQQQRRQTIAQQLTGALHSNEIQVVYRPVMQQQQETLMALAAVPTWKHPAYGRIGASTLLSIADEYELTVPLLQWLWQTATQQFVIAGKGIVHNVQLLLPLSRQQLDEPSFGTQLHAALQTAHMPPRLLQVQVQETDLPLATAQWETLESLHQLQITVGLPYSATALQHIDTVDVFTAHMEDEHIPATLAAMYRTTQQHHTQLMVTGCRTAQQYQQLTCDLVAGPLWPVAIPDTDIREWLHDQSDRHPVSLPPDLHVG